MVGERLKDYRGDQRFRLWMGDGNLLVTQFVLNADFTNLKVFAVDQNGDGDNEIGVGGIETKGLTKGPGLPDL